MQSVSESRRLVKAGTEAEQQPPSRADAQKNAVSASGSPVTGKGLDRVLSDCLFQAVNRVVPRYISSLKFSDFRGFSF